MVAAFAGAGYYFGKMPRKPDGTRSRSDVDTGRSPTKSTSESPVAIAKGGMPWESGGEGKYKYHPGGDPKAEPREAPSALNVVVVPAMTLPKVCTVSIIHEAAPVAHNLAGGPRKVQQMGEGRLPLNLDSRRHEGNFDIRGVGDVYSVDRLGTIEH